MLSFLIGISTTKAAFLSLIIPGAGDIALGNVERGSKFMIAEGLFWAGYGVYTYLGIDARNEYINFAYLKAGSNPERKDETYLNAMEWYESYEDYNEYVKELARYMYPDTTDTTILNERREFIETHSISPEDGWEWKSDEDFKKYIELRKRSRSYFNTAITIVSFTVVNRLVSFILTTYVSDNVSLRFNNRGVQLTWRFW